MGESDDDATATKAAIPLSRSRVNFAVNDPVESSDHHHHHHSSHNNSSSSVPHVGSRGMLRQRSKSSFGKVYSELSPDDNEDAECPSSPVGFMWPSSNKSSAHHLENIGLNFSTQQLSSSPQLFCDAPEHSGDMEAGPQGHGGLASRRNRSRLTVRVDPLCSPMETKEEPSHYQHQKDYGYNGSTLEDAVKRKLHAQGFMPKTPKGLRGLASSLEPRILLLIVVILILALALIVVSVSRVRTISRTVHIEERVQRIEDMERRRGRVGGDSLMPDLFTSMLGVGENDVDEKLKMAWNHIFLGDPLEESCYFEVKDDMAYMLNTESDWVTSEGMSYGIMIATMMGKRAELDRLWKWTRVYMRNKSGDHKGLLAWKLSTNGTALDPMPAPDAETYIATALLIAHSKWGNTPMKPGEQGYLADARELISTMANPKTGLFNAEGEVIFAPNPWGRNHTNPSYHLPAFYEMWARVYEREEIPGAPFWHKAAKRSRLLLKKAVNIRSGLAPDYSYLNGAAAPDEYGHGNFQYDAWRVGANLAIDWAWWGRDAWQRAHADTLQNFFMTKGIKSYTSVYNLQGEAQNKGKEHSVGLMAVLAASSLAATRRGTAAAFVQELWDAELPSGKFRYYGAMLYFLGLLQVSGRFRPV